MGSTHSGKVVALIFSAARLPRLLEEICWQFAAGLPAFSSLPFFSRPQLRSLKSWHAILDPRQGPERRYNSCPSLARQLSQLVGRVWGPNMGSRFGSLNPQFWGLPHLGPPNFMLFWLLVCARRACNLPEFLRVKKEAFESG